MQGQEVASDSSRPGSTQGDIATRLCMREVDYGLLVLLLFPLLLLVFNNSWIFTSYLYPCCDPWGYTAFFHNFPDLQRALPNERVIGRMPWNLVGYIVNQAFPLPVSNYILHVGFYYVAVVSLYLVLKVTINQKTALLASLIMGSYSWFLISIGWDMPEGAAGAYGLLTIALLTGAAKTSHWRPLLFFAGITSAAMLHTNLGTVIFFGFQVTYYVFAHWQFRKNPLISSAIFFVAGAMMLTGILGSISKAVGSVFLFFVPQFSFGMRMVQDTSLFFQFRDAWFNEALWLVFPLAAFLGCLLWLILLGRVLLLPESECSKPFAITQQSFSRFFCLAYISVVVIYVALNFAGQTWLPNPYYAGLYFPFLALATGALMAPLVARLNERQFNLIIAGAVIVLSLPFMPALYRILSYSDPLPIWASLGLLLLGMFVLCLMRGNAYSLVIFLLCVSLANINVADQKRISPYGGSRIEDGYRAIVKAAQVVKRYHPDYRISDRVWYDSHEQNAGLYWASSIVTCSFGTWNKLGEPFTKDIRAGERIVVFSEDPNALQRANKSLSASGLGSHLIATEVVEQGSFRLTMTFIEVQKNGD